MFAQNAAVNPDREKAYRKESGEMCCLPSRHVMTVC